jgi:hypothetical protein
MEPLFRFVLVRPAVAQDPENPSIDLAQETPFQQKLAEAAKAEQAYPALLRTAREFVNTPDFIGSLDANPLVDQLEKFGLALDDLENDPAVSHDRVVDAVEDAFGAVPGQLVQRTEFNTAMQNLRDSLLAIKQLQEEHGRPIEALTNQLRDLDLIEKAANDPQFPTSPADLRRFRRRSLQLPLELTLKSVLSTSELEAKRRKAREKTEAERKKRIDKLFDKYRNLNQAVEELTHLGGEHYQRTPQKPHDGIKTPEELTPNRVLTHQVAYLEKLSELNLGQLQAAMDRDNGGDPVRAQDRAGANSAAELAKNILTSGPRLMTGSPAIRPEAMSEVGFRLKASSVEVLSESTKKMLDERKLRISEEPLDRIVELLQAEIETAGKELDLVYTRPKRHSIKRFGDTLVTVTEPQVAAWPSNGFGPSFEPAPDPLPPVEQIPTTRGAVAPAGIADLLIVKQQLTGYEAADVAHIENVLKGERKLRDHTRRQETEEFTFLEREVTTSQERELESTDRFEMTRETSTVIKEDAALKAGLNISGKYGPTVEFSASAEGSTSRSKEEATRAASSFSQEVTDRSANRITERVLERASLKVTNEVIEKNEHELNNVEGLGHISGVYQWVSKVYQAQMFNYGQRTMFDFMVPEPAAFLIQALNSVHASATEIQKPPEFTLKPHEISENIHAYGYYGKWVQTYGATDVTPPPEIYRTKSLDFNAGGGDAATNYYHSGQIMIDDGYRAVHGSVGAVNMMWNNGCVVDVVLGKRFHRFVNVSGAVFSTPLDEERDSIPFALVTFSVPHLAVAVEVKCQRTDRAMEKWRIETHAKLTNAYKARLAEYEEKLASLELQQGVAIRGKNPALNLETMYDELKKNCISILTDQHFDLFGAIDLSSTNNLPQINVSEAETEGAYVRFFEHAFEWEHLTWVTYPYFWGRKNQWEERLAFEDPDPLFNQFLKAGFCRVSVPARPGFEGAIDHFMTYGEPWNGGPLPPISSPEYLAIADEIAERLDMPGEEIPQGDPWQVRIPTTLVHLRDDDKLPRWQQDPAGNWVEV